MMALFKREMLRKCKRRGEKERVGRMRWVVAALNRVVRKASSRR